MILSGLSEGLSLECREKLVYLFSALQQNWGNFYDASSLEPSILKWMSNLW